MSPRKWYIQYNDSVHGPFTSNQLRQMAERSQLTPDVKVRVGENGAWRPASSVKGLVINGAPTDISMSSELSSEDIPSPESSHDSSSSGELSSESFEDAPSNQSASFGEMRSEAPPVPGEVPVRGTVPPHSELPHRGELPPPHFSQIGEMPSPPPPIEGSELGRAHSSRHSGRKRRSPNAIPNLIQALISQDEQILYAAHPAFSVLLIQNGLTLMCYLFLGIIPSAIMLSNHNEANSGGSWLVYSTLALIIVMVIHYLRWIRSSYVITNQRTFVKSGIFSVEVGYIYNANIQMLKIRTGLIDKILHLNTIELRTSAGFLTLRWTPLTEILQFYR